ncbi:MAG TPA: hypothetical protein DCP90_06180 [Clostridiales bacterium]|nr:MAG: hypothetical protein A2Y22_09120 [Clostridiales bacterium GWD2_32_59]HAN10182.1 hypothetical protein [Clostridiales bacterium]
MLKAIVLAAGKGSRMNSMIPKVLHEINNKTLIQHVLDVVKMCNFDRVFVVISSNANNVIEAVKNDVIFVEQKDQLGTGHAVMQVEEYIDDIDDIIVLCGDSPLITSKTLNNIMDMHIKSNDAATIITTILDNPMAYGRIIRDNEKNIISIVEKKDANNDQINIKEINSGIYCFKGKYLKEALKKIQNNNKSNEYYLPDTIRIIINEGYRVGSYIVNDYTEILGVNTQEDLVIAREILDKRNK